MAVQPNIPTIVSSVAPISTVEPTTESPIISPEDLVINLPEGKVEAVTDNQVLAVGIGGKEPIFSLDGPTCYLTDAYPGYSGSSPITIVNSNDHSRTFHLMIQQPGASLTSGYERFPQEYLSWFSIEDLSPKVAIGGTKKVSVTISVPFKFPAHMKGGRYDLRILVEDWSQTGFVQHACQQKWLIKFAE